MFLKVDRIFAYFHCEQFGAKLLSNILGNSTE